MIVVGVQVASRYSARHLGRFTRPCHLHPQLQFALKCSEKCVHAQIHDQLLNQARLVIQKIQSGDGGYSQGVRSSNCRQ